MRPSLRYIYWLDVALLWHFLALFDQCVAAVLRGVCCADESPPPRRSPVFGLGMEIAALEVAAVEGAMLGAALCACGIGCVGA